jgi:hypothetical protein
MKLAARSRRALFSKERLKCAYCHDSLSAGVRCAGCGAVAHRECQALLERCPTLGCRTSGRWRRLGVPWVRLALAVGVSCAALWGAWSWNEIGPNWPSGGVAMVAVAPPAVPVEAAAPPAGPTPPSAQPRRRKQRVPLATGKERPIDRTEVVRGVEQFLDGLERRRRRENYEAWIAEREASRRSGALGDELERERLRDELHTEDGEPDPALTPADPATPAPR